VQKLKFSSKNSPLISWSFFVAEDNRDQRKKPAETLPSTLDLTFAQ